MSSSPQTGQSTSDVVLQVRYQVPRSARYPLANTALETTGHLGARHTAHSYLHCFSPEDNALMLSKEDACFVPGQELISSWTVERKAK